MPLVPGLIQAYRLAATRLLRPLRWACRLPVAAHGSQCGHPLTTGTAEYSAPLAYPDQQATPRMLRGCC